MHLHKHSSELELRFTDASTYLLTSEYLRICSPSAEVRGHGKGQEVLQTGKRHVKLTHIEAVGNYAIKLTFDDGHDTGIYSWHYLYELCTEHETLWSNYLDRLAAANASREALPAGTQAINIMPLNPKK